jgi:hypothetical protein
MLRRLTLPLAVLAVFAFAAPAAQAAKGMALGIQDDSVLVDQFWGSPAQLYPRAKQLHTTWIRTMVTWYSTMPFNQAAAKKKPKTVKYTFKKYDNMIAAARKKGFKVQVVLTGPAPAWATSNKKVGATTSVNPSATQYGKWAGLAAKHFRAKKVTRYSIWNEPNHFGYLAQSGKKTVAKQAKLYRNLYKYGYKAVRKAYPKSQILFGELAPYYKKGQSYSPLTFLRSVLGVNAKYTKRNKKYPKFVADGFAQHPYDNYRAKRRKDDVTMNSLSHLTKALDKLAKLKALKKRTGGKLAVYLTEFGYFSRRANKNTVAITPESKRAKAATTAYTTALKNSRVKEMVWYQMYEPPRGNNVTWLSFYLRLNNQPMQTFTSLVSWGNKYKSKLGK